MSAVDSLALEETLRLIAEASERAERGAREARSVGGVSAAALEQADRELRRLYKALLDGTVLGGGKAEAEQLELGAAA
jgi:hypothetical protein